MQILSLFMHTVIGHMSVIKAGNGMLTHGDDRDPLCKNLSIVS